MNAVSMDAPARAADEGPGTPPGSEYLAFRLGKEEYGIDILQVQEIRSYEEPTRLVGAPAFIKGMVNLRGVIVPIVDLRIRFGLPQADYDSLTVVIVLNVGTQVVGLVVDSVSDVVRIDAAQLRAVPATAAAVDDECLKAIGQLPERMLILLDMEKFVLRLGLAR